MDRLRVFFTFAKILLLCSERRIRLCARARVCQLFLASVSDRLTLSLHSVEILKLRSIFCQSKRRNFISKQIGKKTNKATKMDRGIDDSLKIKAKVQIYLDYLTYKSI